jgi:hypothetical protein
MIGKTPRPGAVQLQTSKKRMILRKDGVVVVIVHKSGAVVAVIHILTHSSPAVCRFHDVNRTKRMRRTCRAQGALTNIGEKGCAVLKFSWIKGQQAKKKRSKMHRLVEFALDFILS